MKTFWIGDYGTATGLSRVSENIISRLPNSEFVIYAGNLFNPITSNHTVIPSCNRMEPDRLEQLLEYHQPDCIVINQDPWVIGKVINTLTQYADVIAYVPLDCPNLKPSICKPLNNCKHVIAYTKWEKGELIKSGLLTDCQVIPHGVDRTIYYPEQNVRKDVFHWARDDEFVVGIVGRNFIRKRLDLAIRIFAQFSADKPEAMLYYHGALFDSGWDIPQLADYYGITDRLIFTSRDMKPCVGVTEEVMRHIYNCFDVSINTSLGEGFGLPVLEAAACGVPLIVPDYSGLGDWCEAALKAPIGSHEHLTGGLNTLGGCVDEQAFVNLLNKVYSDKQLRAEMGSKALDMAKEPRFNWDKIAGDFEELIMGCNCKKAPRRGERLIHKRPGTNDDNIWRDVHDNNEYGLPASMTDLVVVDIGAHIGAFTALANERGANVFSYEATPGSFELLRRNCSGRKNIKIHHLAVWSETGADLHLSPMPKVGADPINSGGCDVFATDGPIVKSISLDDILDQFDHIDVLKIDCEGAEDVILCSCKTLSKVKIILGEYHSDRMDLGKMADYLTEQGFSVQVEPERRVIGWFEARRS